MFLIYGHYKALLTILSLYSKYRGVFILLVYECLWIVKGKDCGNYIKIGLDNNDCITKL